MLTTLLHCCFYHCYEQMKNTPFVRKIVHIHIADVPAAINANTIHSTGGSKALIAGKLQQYCRLQ